MNTGTFLCERKLSPQFLDVRLEEDFSNPRAARVLVGGNFGLGEILLHAEFLEVSDRS